MVHLKLLDLDHFSGQKFTNSAFPLQQSTAFLVFLPFSSTHPWMSFKAKMDRAVLLPANPFFAIACARGRSEGSFTLRNSWAVIPPNLRLLQMPKPSSLTKCMTASENKASSWSANHADGRAWKTLLFSAQSSALKFREPFCDTSSHSHISLFYIYCTWAKSVGWIFFCLWTSSQEVWAAVTQVS